LLGFYCFSQLISSSVSVVQNSIPYAPTDYSSLLAAKLVAIAIFYKYYPIISYCKRAKSTRHYIAFSLTCVTGISRLSKIFDIINSLSCYTRKFCSVKAIEFRKALIAILVCKKSPPSVLFIEVVRA